MLDNQVKEKFIELRAQGKSFSVIADEIKVSKPTLIQWSKEFEYEIANLKAIELESLQERYYVQKQKRVELFGKQIDVIKEELSKRDLKQVSTERLFDLLARFLGALRQEQTPVEFIKKGELDLSSIHSPLKWTA